MAWVSLGTAAITAGGNVGAAVLSNKGNKGNKNNDSRFMSDHNKKRIELGTKALEDVSQYAKTGKLGKYQAGEEYTGDLGAYNLSDIQNLSLDQLKGLITGGLPETYTKGRDVLSSFIDADYDPTTSDLYKGFRTGVQRERGEALDQLKRDMAVTGDLYSTETARQAGLLGERTQESLQNKLAELTDTNIARRLDVAGDLTQMGFQEGDYAAKNIGLGMSLGDIQRALKDKQAKDKYSEYKRQRSEWYDTVDTAKSIAGFGTTTMPETSQETDSPFSELINKGLELAGGYVGDYFSKKGETKSTPKTPPIK